MPESLESHTLPVDPTSKDAVGTPGKQIASYLEKLEVSSRVQLVLHAMNEKKSAHGARGLSLEANHLLGSEPLPVRTVVESLQCCDLVLVFPG